MDFLSKMMDFLPKTIDFLSKMMHFPLNMQDHRGLEFIWDGMAKPMPPVSFPKINDLKLYIKVMYINGIEM